jgi:hypothetical protein
MDYSIKLFATIWTRSNFFSRFVAMTPDGLILFLIINLISAGQQLRTDCILGGSETRNHDSLAVHISVCKVWGYHGNVTP